jgi:hypothetical protein
VFAFCYLFHSFPCLHHHAFASASVTHSLPVPMPLLFRRLMNDGVSIVIFGQHWSQGKNPLLSGYIG